MTSTKNIRTISRNCWILRFPVALLSFAGLAGCNSCVTFSSNPPNGTLGIVSNDPRLACSLPKVQMSAVRLRMTSGPICPSCIGSGRIQHVFLAIRGIELNPTAAARDDSPDWQEVLPEDFAAKPLQVDLMESKAEEGVPKSLAETAQFPAGVYRDLRVRFATNQQVADDRLPAGNPCGSGILNCIVMADGGIHPLQLDDDSPKLRIAPDRMEGASLLFPPDTRTDLIIEWKLAWELSSSADKGVRLLPALAGSAKVSRTQLEELGTPEDAVLNDFRFK